MSQQIFERDGEWIVIGELRRKTLEDPSRFPWFSVPQRADAVKGNLTGVEFLIYLGTWCGDTHEQLPEFLAVTDCSGIRNVRLFGLDRDKKLEEWTERYRIERLPTFVALRDGVEIGRITETPKNSMAEDLAEILRS